MQIFMGKYLKKKLVLLAKSSWYASSLFHKKVDFILRGNIHDKKKKKREKKTDKGS